MSENKLEQKTDFEIDKIKLIIGLGNAEQKYIYTRHNAGFLFLDFIAQSVFINLPKFKCHISEVKIEDNKIMLIKPTTMMNNSGESATLVKNFYKFNNEEILVIYDDLDLELGKYKLQLNKAPKVHNGVASIKSHLEGSNFWSLRIGVDSRTEDGRKNIAGSDYVLGKFKQDELQTLKTTFENIVQDVFI